MKKRRLYYGWFSQKDLMFRVSRMPPDSPVRPSVSFQSRVDALEMAQKQRAEIMWLPPLTPDLMNYQSSL